MADIFQLFRQISQKRDEQSPGGTPQWLIVGLGNPGDAYTQTRHNAGFLTIEALGKQLGVSGWKLRFHAELGEAVFAGQRILLARPQTFMNNSGQAVHEILEWYKIPADHMIVVYDDISLEPGRLRIRKKGSDGGHNGIKSILYQTGTDAFPRIKLGIGAPPSKEYDLADWVLGKFPTEAMEHLNDAIGRAILAAEVIMKEGCDAAASKFNASLPAAKKD